VLGVFGCGGDTTVTLTGHAVRYLKGTIYI